jgi:hypothetical protein
MPANSADLAKDLAVVALLVVLHFCAFDGVSIFAEPSRSNVLEALLVIAVAAAITVMWRHREQLDSIDRSVMTVPIAAWAIATVLMKMMSAVMRETPWRDKGLFNVLGVEPAIVGILASMTVIAFCNGGLRATRVRRSLLIGLCCICVAVAFFLPRLPD